MVKLGDAELMVADPRTDIRGRMVIDRDGQAIGHVDALLIDSQARLMRFFAAASGGFLGIGARNVLPPDDAVTHLDHDRLDIDQTAARIAAGPACDSNLVYDRTYNGDVAGYYGYAPYWGPGCIYSSYPHCSWQPSPRQMG